MEYLKAKNNKDYYFFIKVLGTTGARLSEFQQFTWEDIISGEVILKGKGNKYRRFFFQKQLQQEAKVYAKEYGKTGIFAVGRFGPITQRGFSQHLKAWGKHCGIDCCFQWFKDTNLKANHNKIVIGAVSAAVVSNGSKILI